MIIGTVRDDRKNIGWITRSVRETGRFLAAWEIIQLEYAITRFGGAGSGRDDVVPK